MEVIPSPSYLWILPILREKGLFGVFTYPGILVSLSECYLLLLSFHLIPSFKKSCLQYFCSWLCACVSLITVITKHTHTHTHTHTEFPNTSREMIHDFSLTISSLWKSEVIAAVKDVSLFRQVLQKISFVIANHKVPFCVGFDKLYWHKLGELY